MHKWMSTATIWILFGISFFVESGVEKIIILSTQAFCLMFGVGIEAIINAIKENKH